MAIRLSKLELLLDEARLYRIEVKNATLPKRIKGLYFSDNNLPPVIALNKQCIEGMSEELCIMAEEIGHHFTSAGDLLSNSIDKAIIVKQEQIARKWAVKRIASLTDIINAYENGAQSLYEMAEYMDITEDFLCRAIELYRRKHGLMTEVGDKYIVYFEPFGVLKKISVI
jgi:hypothetical protein